LIRPARNEWEKRFASKDPSDACVSVRVTSADAKTRSVPASGFLKVRAKTFRRLAAKFSFPRLAR
jgi:hypothetical protein